MSPTLALQSPSFLFYVTLAASLLVVAGVLLAVLKWGLGKNVDHAWQAYCGWLVMVPLLIGGFFLGREATVVFLTAVAILAFQEFARATELRSDHLISGAVQVGIIATGVVCL